MPEDMRDLQKVREVLLVDPHQRISSFVVDLLIHNFLCKISVVRSFDEALAVLDVHDIDLVISDCDHSGNKLKELLLYLEQREMDIPVLFLSDYDYHRYLFKGIDVPNAMVDRTQPQYLTEIISLGLDWPLRI